ncbi:MAG: ATP-binding protein [Bacteroidetes bacterium]|nr:ATP-binding protein [Bacteroidota bacterium]
MRESIEILLQSGEGQYIEYKGCFDKKDRSAPKPRSFKEIAKDIAISLAEFANADGGVLLLGVENDGTITGSPYRVDDIERIKHIAADSWKKKVPYQVVKTIPSL